MSDIFCCFLVLQSTTQTIPSLYQTAAHEYDIVSIPRVVLNGSWKITSLYQLPEAARKDDVLLLVVCLRFSVVVSHIQPAV